MHVMCACLHAYMRVWMYVCIYVCVCMSREHRYFTSCSNEGGPTIKEADAATNIETLLTDCCADPSQAETKKSTAQLNI